MVGVYVAVRDRRALCQTSDYLFGGSAASSLLCQICHRFHKE